MRIRAGFWRLEEPERAMRSSEAKPDPAQAGEPIPLAAPFFTEVKPLKTSEPLPPELATVC